MPSVKDELAGVGILDGSKTLEKTTADVFTNVHRSREHRHNEEVIDDVTDLEKLDDVINEPTDEEEDETYSDFTEKLQSFYPECKYKKSTVTTRIPTVDVPCYWNVMFQYKQTNCIVATL